MSVDKTQYEIGDFLEHREYRRPNLQLRVDFTDLMYPDRPVSEDVDLIYDSVQVWLAFTEDMNDVTNSTSPIALFPGANLLSVADFNIRQKLKPGALATLGFDVRFLLAVQSIRKLMTRGSYSKPSSHRTFSTPPRIRSLPQPRALFPLCASYQRSRWASGSYTRTSGISQS